MAEQNDRAFTGSIPALYERYMVPLLFEPYAEDLAARAKALAPRRLLEIAAGTGVVTRALAAALPATAITATDLNEAMLDFAITKLTARHVTYRPADGQALPFPDASFDMVACQFGVMFFPDRVQGFREARRVLASGGRYLFSVWADLGANDIRRGDHRGAGGPLSRQSAALPHAHPLWPSQYRASDPRPRPPRASPISRSRAWTARPARPRPMTPPSVSARAARCVPRSRRASRVGWKR